MWLRVIALALLAMASIASSPLAGEGGAAELGVLASIFPLADMARQVGGDKVVVQTLLPSGASPHTYEPTPSKIMAISRAKVFFTIGMGLEFWIKKAANSAANPSLVAVDISEAVGARDILKQALKGEGAQGKLSQEDISENTHYWLDPVIAKSIAREIAKTYQRLDPSNESYYAKRLEKFLAELDSLHEEISRRTAGFKYRSFVSFHAAWSYFAWRYRLEQAGVIEDFPGKEPTPAKMAQLVDIIKKSGARVVFAEPQFNPGVAQALARETGVKLLLLDPLGGEDLPDRSSYVKLMRYNLEAIEKGLN